MNKILIATHNQAKFEEIKNSLIGLEKINIKLISLNEVNIVTEPVESGNTFQDNSLLKAKYYGELSSLPTIADDAGLIIPYLNNEPGVKSRRWPGHVATDKELIDYALLRLNGIEDTNRTAYLQTCVTFFDPQSKLVIQQTEKIKGRIAKKSNGMQTNGFPFRAIFIVDRINKYYGDLSKKEHEEINHRRKALYVLMKKIKSNLVE